MLNLLIGITFCFIFDVTAQSRDFCTMPDGNSGTCTSWEQCDYLKAFMENKGIDVSEKHRLLKESHCGFRGREPLVCCGNKRSNSSLPDVSNHPNLKLLTGNKKTCGAFLSTKFTADYPWMALIVYDNSKVYCGGSIINERYILTAAHCVVGFREDITISGVRVGTTDLFDAENCGKMGCDYQDLLIESSHFHPGYSKPSMQNDIALLRLERDIDFNSGIIPICLPFENHGASSFTQAEVAGWGISKKLGPQHSYLQEMFVDIVHNDKCTLPHFGIINQEEMKLNQMCVTTETRDKKFGCIGDSGGLLQKVLYSKYVQYGISTSLDATCRYENSPEYYIFTRVEYYLDWILDTIRE